MSSSLEIDGKKYEPIKVAAGLVSYSKDYVTRLAREEKIQATHVGRQWFVDVDSLIAYEEQAEKEKEQRRKELSAIRKQERAAVVASDSLMTAQVANSKVDYMHMRAVAGAVLTTFVGVILGSVLYLELPTGSVNTPEVDVLPVVESVALDLSKYTDVLEDQSQLAVVYDSVTESEEPDQKQVPEMEIVSLGDVTNGIVLYPAGQVASTAALFSDPVIVSENEYGTAVVQRVDSAGRVVEIPFVEVPVITDSL